MTEPEANVLPAPLPPPEPPTVFTRLSSNKTIVTTDATVTRLIRLLSTTSGVDSVLGLLYYTLTLVRSQVSRLIALQTDLIARRITANASKTLLPGETLIANIRPSADAGGLPALHARLKALTSLISDFRTFSRLWGIFGMYAWTKTTIIDPPKDSLVHAVTWVQIVLNTWFFTLEHGAYLAGKGFYQGWSKAKIKRWNDIAAKAFLGHMALQYIKLGREWQLRARQVEGPSDVPEDKEAKMRRVAEVETWRRSVLITAAFTPLAVHWSTEGGVLSEFWVGLFGSVASVNIFRGAWKRAAA